MLCALLVRAHLCVASAAPQLSFKNARFYLRDNHPGYNMNPPTDRLPQAEINRRALDSEHVLENLGARTVNGSALALGAQLTRMVLQFLSTFILARLLAPADFGLLAMAATVTAFVGAFTDLGLQTATVQRKDIDQNLVSGFLLVGIGVAAGMALLLFAFAPFSVLVFDDDRIPLLLMTVAASLPVGALGAQHSALLTRQMRWLTLHSIGLFSQLLGLIAAVALAAWTDIGYWALVVQIWVNAGVSSMLAWMMCPWRPSRITDWGSVRGALGFGLNLTGFAFANYFHRQLDNVLVGWKGGATELGYYSRAYSLLLLPLNLVNGPLSSALLPALSRVQNDPVRWREAYLTGLSAVTIVSAGISAVLFGGSKVIIPLIFGPGWDDARLIFSALAPCMLATTPMNTTAWIYMSLGRTDLLLRWALIASPTYAVAFVIGLPAGGFGVALGYTVAATLLMLPCFWMATRRTTISMRDVVAVLAPPTVVAILLGPALEQVCARVGFVPGLVAIFVAGVLYAAASVIMIVWMPQYGGLKAMSSKTLSRVQHKLVALRGGAR